MRQPGVVDTCRTLSGALREPAEHGFEIPIRGEAKISDAADVDLFQASESLAADSRNHCDGQRVELFAAIVPCDDDKSIGFVQI
ncbi:MAG: hypothetical protein OEU40_05165 [Gammaproteobacteria bacterium]|nr:hypothetical protein [Gammaproteobacteria bacterium]